MMACFTTLMTLMVDDFLLSAFIVDVFVDVDLFWPKYLPMYMVRHNYQMP